MSIIFWDKLVPSQRESETATACMSLLRQRLSGKITEDEFEKEMHYVVLLPDCLKDHEFKETPPKTIEVQKALEALEAEKKELRSGEFVDMAAFHKAFPCILGYQEKVESVTRTNQRNAETLEECHTFFKKLGDTVSLMKIWEAYQTYPVSMWIGNQCIWKRRTL